MHSETDNEFLLQKYRARYYRYCNRNVLQVIFQHLHEIRLKRQELLGASYLRGALKS